MLLKFTISRHHSTIEFIERDLLGHVRTEFDDALAVAGDHELDRFLLVVSLLPLHLCEDQVVAVRKIFVELHVHVAMRPRLLFLDQLLAFLVGATDLVQLEDTRRVVVAFLFIVRVAPLVLLSDRDGHRA